MEEKDTLFKEYQFLLESTKLSENNQLILSRIDQSKLEELIKLMINNIKNINNTQPFLNMILSLTINIGPFFILKLLKIENEEFIKLFLDKLDLRNKQIRENLTQLYENIKFKTQKLDHSLPRMRNFRYFENLIKKNNIEPVENLKNIVNNHEDLYLDCLITHEFLFDYMTSLKKITKQELKDIFEHKKKLKILEKRLIEILGQNLIRIHQKIFREKIQIGKTIYSELEIKEKSFFDNPIIQQANIQQKKPLKKYTFFTKGDSLPIENEEIEYKNYFFPFGNEQKSRLQKLICAFLNTDGGRIYLGVKDQEFLVNGIHLKSFDKKGIKEEFINIFDLLNPKVDQKKWKMLFLPVYQKNNTIINDCYVVKIIIKKGKKNQLYFTSEEEVYKRRDGKNNMLHAADIKEEVRKRTKLELDPLDENGEFSDPEPDIELKNNKTNFLKYYVPVGVTYDNNKNELNSNNNKPIDILNNFEKKEDKREINGKILKVITEGNIDMLMKIVIETKMFFEKIVNKPKSIIVRSQMRIAFFEFSEVFSESMIEKLKINIINSLGTQENIYVDYQFIEKSIVDKIANKYIKIKV